MRSCSAEWNVFLSAGLSGQSSPQLHPFFPANGKRSVKYSQVPGKVSSQRYTENKEGAFGKLDCLKHGLDSESRHLTIALI